MPEYSSTTITPADGVKTPAMNGSTSGNYTLSALRDFILASKGQANGLASLDANGKLPSSQLPDLADDVIVVASYASLPATGTAGKIYITADNNKMYRWDPDLETPNYVELSIDLSEYARIVDIQDGNIQAGVAVKAFQDAMGRAIITTYATKADLQDGTLVVKEAEIASKDEDGNNIKATYETKADASDLKSAIDANSKRITNLEQKAGDELIIDYPHPTYGMDEVPPNVAEYGKVTKLRGVTRVKNNVAPKIEIGSGWDSNPTFGTGVVSDNKIVYTITTQSENQSFRRTTGNGGVVFKANHVSLIFFDLTLSEASDHVRVCYMDTLWTSDVSVLANVKTRCAFIVAPTAVGANTYFAVYPNIIDGLSVDATAILENVTVTDLTLYFNGNIPSNAQTIADIQTKYPELLIPSDYDTGTLVDTTYNAVKAVGVNLWDEEWEVGTIDAQGQNASGSSTIRSKNYIPVLPNTAYYITNVMSGIFWYDADKNLISINYSGGTRTSPSNASYLRFYSSSEYGAIYNHDIQICLNSYADKTTYHPYMTDTLTLPSPVELRSAGSVHEELDVESGVITRKIIVKNFADSQWTHVNSGTYGYWISYSHTDILSPVDTSTKAKALCDKYDIIPLSSLSGTTTINCLAVDTSGNVFVNNGSTTNSPTGNGLFVLATPDTENIDPIPDPFIQVEGGGTIRPIQTQTTEIDSAMTAEYLSLGANA